MDIEMAKPIYLLHKSESTHSSLLTYENKLCKMYNRL